MFNVSNETTYERTEHFNWIIPVSLNVLWIVLTLWIIFSLLHYGTKRKLWCRSHTMNADKLIGGAIYKSTVVCSCMALLRLSLGLVWYNIGFGTTSADQSHCEMLSDALFSIYCLFLLSVYIFLWLRQRVFYENQMLHTTFSKPLKFFSGASIFIIFFAGMGVILVSAYPQTYPSSREGCVYEASDRLLDEISWIACAVVLVIGQGILIALFIHPLQRNIRCCCLSVFSSCSDKVDEIVEYLAEKERKNSKSNTKEMTSNTEYKGRLSLQNKHRNRLPKRSMERVKLIMRRTILFGTISVTTDMSLILVSTYATNGTAEHRRLIISLSDFNTFLNLALVVCSFLSFKTMLTSPCKKREEISKSGRSIRENLNS